MNASEGAAPASSVDLLMFEIGGAVYAADAAQVLRIERPQETTLALEELGAKTEGGRALVFQTQEGEGQLRVDAVLGVEGVAVSDLRKLPPVACRRPYALGLFIAEGRAPVLLIDLVETLKSQGR